MGEKPDMPMFLFPGSVGITGGVTDGITDGFTIKTKERKISQENGKADNILLKHQVFQDCEWHP